MSFKTSVLVLGIEKSFIAEETDRLFWGKGISSCTVYLFLVASLSPFVVVSLTGIRDFPSDGRWARDNWSYSE